MICGCQQIENTWYLLYTVYWKLQYKVAFSSQHKHYLLKVIMLCTYRGCQNQEGREAMTPHTIFKSVLWYQSYTCTEKHTYFHTRRYIQPPCNSTVFCGSTSLLQLHRNYQAIHCIKPKRACNCNFV